MLCQNCHLNESTIHLYTNVNGQQKQIDLCQNCYQIMKTDPNNAILGGIGGNPQSSSNQTNQSSNPFDDFFNNLSGFPAFGSQGFQNTPPTQSGEGNNNGRGGNGNNNFRPNGPAQQEPKGLLEEFGINVTDIARRGDIDPVIGRDAEIVRVIEILNRRTKNNPVLIGEPGVGKTELSKQLAIELFGSADSMIRFDMSEYMEKHAVAKLVGAPPGYVGYEEAGQLTEKVRRNPYSLILLDEVEKAHPDVMHMFLQVLDDGRLTDGQGRTVSFKDTIIIMTSNAGTGKVEASVGFGAAREGRTNSVLGQLGDFFSPEFMNRFDGIIEFKALSKDNLLHIVNLMLDDVNNRLATNDIHLEVTDKVKEKLVDLGYDPKMGARPLRRTIQDHIEDAITDFYLEHPTEKDLKAVMTSNGKIIIKSAKKVEKEETVSAE